MLAVQEGRAVSEADLMDYYLAHSANYTIPESVSFRHVFFSTATRGSEARTVAQAAVARNPRWRRI